MMMQHTKQSAPTARRAGFTLAEVLISLGVFGIGMIAVASLFPVAAVLQKETADDILGTQSTLNARATLEAIGLTYAQGDGDTDLGMYHALPTSNNNVVMPVGEDTTPSPFGSVYPTTFLHRVGDASPQPARYTLADRSYPTTEADIAARDHYWLFFARDLAGNPASPSWQGFVLIIDRDSNQNQTYADLVAGLTYGVPTDNVPYITIDGKTGTWNIANPPTITAPASGEVYFHPQGIGVETFVFETLP